MSFNLHPSRSPSLSFTSAPIKCPKLEAHLIPSDFILFRSTPEENAVGQIVNIASNFQEIPISEISNNCMISQGCGSVWCLIRKWTQSDQSDVPDSLNHIPHATKYKVNGVSELIETSQGEWIKSTDVLDIVFIFHLSDFIEDRYFCLNGIENIYFTHITNLTGEFRRIKSDDFNPFPFRNEYRYRIFSSLMYINTSISRFFFRESQSQGNRFSTKIQLSYECWLYISMKIRSSMSISCKHKKYCHKRPRFDLSQSKIRIETAMYYVDIDTTEKMTSFLKIFGSSFGIGLRKKFPRIGYQDNHFVFGDIINVVDFSVKGNGVKLCFDESTSNLSVISSYSSFPATSNSNHLQNLLQNRLLQSVLPEANEKYEVSVVVDDLFQRNGLLYKVININDTSVAAVSFNPEAPNDTNAITIDIEMTECQRLINEFLD